MSLPLLPVVAAAKPAPRPEAVGQLDLRPAAAQRAGRTYFRVEAVSAPAPAEARRPSRSVHRRPVVKAVAPKPVESAPRKPRKAAPYSAPASGSIAVVIQFALAQVGHRYVWGTAGPSTYDCSGLVMAAFLRIGIHLPHQSGGIAARGRHVPAGQWRPGDVLVWSGHVALYLGGGKMVEAANPSAGVRITSTAGRGGSARRIVG
jgi:cell wall-associated NlpC family hydrolase